MIFLTKQLSDNYDHLAPDSSEIRLLPEVSGGGLAHCTLPAGVISKAVKHTTVEEIWYCISGTGQIWRKIADEEEVTDICPETSLTIPVGVHFQFRTMGSVPLRILIVTIPAWPGEHEAVPVEGYWKAS